MSVFALIASLDYVTRPYIISGILAAIVAYLVITRKREDRLLPPAGGKALPLIGDLLSFIGDKPTFVFQRMAKEVGPVFRVYFGTKPVVVLNDFASIRQAFAKTGDDLCSRPRIKRKGGLATAEMTPLFKEQRKFTLLSLRSLGMGRNTMEDRIAQEMDHLIQAFDDTQGKPCNPMPLITRSVSNVISAMAFGERFDYEDANFKRLLGYLNMVFNSTEAAANFVVNQPIIRPLIAIINKIRGVSSEAKVTMDFFKSVVESSTEAAKNDHEHLSYIGMYTKEMLKRTADNETDDTFCEERMQQNTVDLFFAGTETTSTSLRWALLMMITHPGIQQRIYEEIESVIGTDRLPTIQDRANLPYTEAFLMELQRYASVLALGVPHTALVDTVLYGYHVPKDTLIITNTWGIHHDPDVWDEPEKIKPERFLDANENKVIQRDEFVPFGLGRRRCLGEQLAVMEIYLTFTRLIQQFRFCSGEGTVTPSLEGVLRITHMPQPYTMCAVRRRSQESNV